MLPTSIEVTDVAVLIVPEPEDHGATLVELSLEALQKWGVAREGLLEELELSEGLLQQYRHLAILRQALGVYALAHDHEPETMDYELHEVSEVSLGR